MPGQLLVIEGPDKGRVFNLEAGEALLLGRSPGLPHPLSDPAAGLVQCQLEDFAGRLQLTEIGVSGGLCVNGRPASAARLTAGDVIALGETQLVVRREAGRTRGPEPEGPPGEPAAPSAGADPIAALPGSRLSHYRIDRLIVRGATGRCSAQDLKYRRSAAVKVLYPHLTAGKADRERFVRTMRLMLPIRHPNLVGLYSAGTAGACAGRPWSMWTARVPERCWRGCSSRRPPIGKRPCGWGSTSPGRWRPPTSTTSSTAT